MALFRRSFYRKQPDRLLEISERVYVFECCFSTEALEEDEYKVYMGGIVAQLQDYHPDSSFMVFNFREGDTRSQISHILSQYGMTVMDYPRQYEGCSMLPLEMIHHFLRSCDSWLSSAGQQNVLLMHCEMGGWPVLAFMLAALLLFRKQYSGEQKTLEMVYKQIPKEVLCLLTPLNPQPSQLRYLQYVSRGNVGSNWSPSDTPLALDHIVLRSLPLFDEKGCRPVVRVYGQDLSSTTANRSSKLLFTSSKTINQARYYKPAECELVKIDIHRRVQGDVVVECVHFDHDKEEIIFRVMFHTTFVQSSVLILSRDEVDVKWDGRDQMSQNFRSEVYFSDNVLDWQDDLLPKEFKVDPKIVDIVPPPPPPPPPMHAAPCPQIVKGFEHLKIQLEDIKLATNTFNESEVIGRGGFGKVYRGKVFHSKGKSMCALKRLDPRLGQGDAEFWKEILMLSGYKHENLISLKGYCDEGGERIIVYEYASNGSLDRHLSSTRLTWIQRIKICLDAARGLSFLHDDKGTMQRVIHRDIKSSNILLDDNWNAKVSDMGLSKLGPANQPHTFLITGSIVGTPGYCDPQYVNSYTLSKESDVYSFGVVLFEVLCGRLCCNYNNGQLDILVPTWKKAYKQKKLHEVVFQGLTQPMDLAALETFSGIAFQCLQKSREERPTIADVVRKLERALEFQKPLEFTSRVYQGSIWYQLQGHGESQSEFDASELETLFPTRGGWRQSAGSEHEKVRLVDLRRANDTEIMLLKIKMPLPDMIAAALAMDESVLYADQIKNLIKFYPTKKEMELLKNYTGDKEMLGKCEQFFLELMKVPRMESKLRVFLFKIQFNTQLSEFKTSLNTVNNACDEIRKSVKLREIMKRVLHLLNTLNQGTDRGSAIGFKLGSLLKLADTLASNSSMTLMHYLCKVLASKSPELLDFHVDLVSLESATKIQLKSLSEELQAIIKGLEKVIQERDASEDEGPVSQVYYKTLKEFIGFAQSDVTPVIKLYHVMVRNSDYLSLYFSEDPIRYPFEQVTQTLLKFVRLFRIAHQENHEQAELER